MAKPVNVKKTDLQIYVLSEPTMFTPKGDEDLELVHAGLEKRLLSVPDTLKHSEVIANIMKTRMMNVAFACLRFSLCLRKNFLN